MCVCVYVCVCVRVCLSPLCAISRLSGSEKICLFPINGGEDSLPPSLSHISPSLSLPPSFSHSLLIPSSKRTFCQSVGSQPGRHGHGLYYQSLLLSDRKCLLKANSSGTILHPQFTVTPLCSAQSVCVWQSVCVLELVCACINVFA